MKLRILNFSKQLLFYGIAIFAIIFLQTFISMYNISGVSASCLDCSYFEDVFGLSFMSSIFLSFLFILIAGIKNKVFQTGLQAIFLIAVMFCLNYQIFVDRESAWSTYDFNEEIYYT